MTKPLLYDMYSGAGGAAKGYMNAGFRVIGIDNRPQPRYCGDGFIQMDVFEFLERYAHKGFERADAIHASPPCQAYSRATKYNRADLQPHPNLLDPTRQALSRLILPWIIENVPGAPIRHDLMLCGELFGLLLHRHRFFEMEGWLPTKLKHVAHRLKSAKDNCHIEDGYTRVVAGHYADHAGACRAMGIDWMVRGELNEAVPPAYTYFIGQQLLKAIRE